MALSVASSSYSAGITQVDGTHWVVEYMTLTDGSTRVSQYLAAPDCDLDQHLSDTVTNMNNDLAGT